jgi:nitrate reductase NapD
MKEIPELEIHGDSGQGKLVVVLEAESEWQLLEQIQTIRDIDEVYSASLVHHHCEKAETLEEEMHEDHTP